MVLGIGTTLAVRSIGGRRAADQRKGLRWLRLHKAQAGPKGRQLLAQDSSCILRMVQLLTSTRSDVRSEAAACLTELTCHSESQVCWVMVETPGLLEGLGEVLLTTRCAGRCDKEVVAAVATSIGYMASSSGRVCCSMVAVPDVMDGLKEVLGHPYLPLDEHMVQYWAAQALEALAADASARKCIAEAPDVLDAVVSFTQRVSHLPADSAPVHLAQAQAGQLVRVLASEACTRGRLQQEPELLACLQQLAGSAVDSVRMAAAAALEELGPSVVIEPADAAVDEACSEASEASSSCEAELSPGSLGMLDGLTAEDLQPVEAALQRTTTAASQAVKAAEEEADWKAAAVWSEVEEAGGELQAVPASKPLEGPGVHLWVRAGGLSVLNSMAESECCSSGQWSDGVE